MRRWRRLTMKVVSTMGRIAEPEFNMETAMNCELPAKTRSDKRPISTRLRLAFWARTPKARPMGT
ncbi:MAG: hypothetical protein H6Q51_2089 [Deltaproteobacteria bacterium]|nr:hypothetical protein [Deltaproteobacteria bacterium]